MNSALRWVLALAFVGLCACASQRSAPDPSSTAGPYPEAYQDVIRQHFAPFFDRRSALAYGFSEPRFVRSENHKSLAQLMQGDAWLVDVNLIVTNPAGETMPAQTYVAAIIDGSVAHVWEKSRGKLRVAEELR